MAKKNIRKQKRPKKPIKKSAKRTASLVRSKKRVRDVGEVFTPKFLVEQMLDQFPKDAWDKDKFWLEPTCGNGNFVLGILKRKIKLGFTLIEALNTTFGMDIMEDNIFECHVRVYEQIVIPYLASNKFTGKVLNDMRVKAICIVVNNLQITKDALIEDWQNKFKCFDDYSQHSKKKAMELVKNKLDMAMGIIPVVNKNSVLYQELLIFEQKDKVNE